MSEKIRQLINTVKEKQRGNREKEDNKGKIDKKERKNRKEQKNSETEESKKIRKIQWTKKKIIAAVVAVAVVIAGVGGGAIYVKKFGKGTDGEKGFGMFGKGGNGNEISYVTASGTTTLGYTMDEFEPDYIETDLYIEEVYLSSGDEVEAGTPVLKVSEESVQEARTELEEKVTETSLAYRAGVISYEQSKISAKYTYDSAVLEGQQAQAVYNSALKEAENKLKTAQDKVTDAEEQIEEYTKATENGSYYYDYDLDNYKKRYETNYNLYNQLLSDWGIAESELNVSMSSAASEFVLLSAPVAEGVQDSVAEASQEEKTSEESSSEGANEESSSEDSSQGGSNEESSSEESSAEEGSSEESSSQESSETNSNEESSSEKESEEKESESETKKETEDQNENSQTVSQNDKERMEKIKVLQQLKKAVQSSGSSYSKAWKEYEEATSKAATQLKKLNAQIDSLRADLTEAQTTYELEKLEAETTYKKAVAQTNLAQSDYDAAIQKASDELEALEDEKTEAEENLKEFETLLGDGYFYTQNAGTVMMIGCESETNLQGGSMVVAYRNAEDISVSVAVSQEDINKLNVGDSAEVILEDYGTYEGVVTYLNPVSTSDSRTNITYEVIVSLKGDDISSLKENLTAEVIFQTGDVEE